MSYDKILLHCLLIGPQGPDLQTILQSYYDKIYATSIITHC